MTTLLFIAKHAAVLLLLLVAAAGAGTLVVGSRFGLALRCALGLAVWGQVLFFLAAAGQLRGGVILVLLVIAMVGMGRTDRIVCPPLGVVSVGVVMGGALLLVALQPPLAFDETLYHLPFVRALAESGELRFLGDLRFPVFPQLHELLCVPLYLLAGDVATHLVSLAEVAITAALLFEWGRRYEARAGSLAAALFLGSPLVVYLSTIGHTDAALTLFVTAGFYCLDRSSFALAGVFFGCACSVKYLGGYFALAALVLVVLWHRRAVWAFLAGCLAAALPTTIWLIASTGNPVFPFLSSGVWQLIFKPISLETRVVRVARVLWDATFAREHTGYSPPITPLLIAAVAIMIAAARRDVRARAVAFICAGFLIVYALHPQDSRYLVPLLPLVSIVAAVSVSRTKLAPWLAAIAIAPGVFYAGYRLVVMGMPPATAAEREAVLRKRIPEYAALMRAGESRVYVCGGEQLKYYARGQFRGDHFGPFAYRYVLDGAHTTASLAERLRRIDAQSYLVVKRACPPPQANGGMELVYEDGAAQLWRVLPGDSRATGESTASSNGRICESCLTRMTKSQARSNFFQPVL